MTRHSLSDEQLIDELEKGREALLSGTLSRTLLAELRRQLRTISRNIYVLKWIPEQREDLYDILIDGVTVVHLEINRSEQQTEKMFQTWPVEAYIKARRELTKPERRKLDLAVRLAAGKGV